MATDKEFVQMVKRGEAKFVIKRKRDFGRYGYWDAKTRTTRFDGFVVVGSDCQIINRMPAATWFKTHAQAMDAIQDLLAVDGDAQAFWALTHGRIAA